MAEEVLCLQTSFMHYRLFFKWEDPFVCGARAKCFLGRPTGMIFRNKRKLIGFEYLPRCLSAIDKWNWLRNWKCFQTSNKLALVSGKTSLLRSFAHLRQSLLLVLNSLKCSNIDLHLPVLISFYWDLNNPGHIIVVLWIHVHSGIGAGMEVFVDMGVLD